MKILMLGGTGFISGRTTQFLLDQGHEVTIYTRGTTEYVFEEKGRLKLVIGDRTDREAFHKTFAGKRFDVVYDMIAYEKEDSESAVELFKGNTGRFIHCSTISVSMVSYDVTPPVTEDQDRGELMEYFPRNPFGMDYGINKRECEDVLWQAHDENEFPVTMLRPVYVCGPGDPAKRDYFWIERMRDGKPLLVPGSGDFALQTVYIDDVAKAFVDILDHKTTIGNAYNIAGREIFSLNEYLDILAEVLERKYEAVHIDQDVFDELDFSVSPEGDAFPFNPRRTAVFSTGKAVKDFNYQMTPIRDWLPVTAEWFINEYKEHSVGYAQRESELKALELWRKTAEDRSKEFLDKYNK